MPSFLESRIIFDDSSLNRIFSNPEPILRDVESFWKEEVPYKAVRGWHSASGTPFTYDKFTSSLRMMLDSGIGDKRFNHVLELRDTILENASTFREKALRHICFYLPSSAPSIDVTVSLVAFMEPVAFARPEGIILNISHEYWADKSIGFLLNILLHELYHFGFHSSFESDEINPRESKQKLIEYVCWWLQNEGIATYVSYSGQNLFHFKESVPDYTMIDRATDVARLSQIVNSILAKCDEETYEKISDTIWGKGVRERAFYVVGGYMAKRIDEELGRDALTGTIGKPPKHFVDTYNKLNDTQILIK
jgi:hypothetical protein